MRSAAKPKNEKYVTDYLTFLGVKIQPSSLAFLSQLMKAHLHKVFFDGSGFTLHQPEQYVLKNSEILAEFRQGKGGICYQINGAFKRLLSLLGFDVTLTSATMFRYGGSAPVPYAEMGKDTHCAILVTFNDKEYLVDLSWGNAFRPPLEVGGASIDIPGEYERRCIKEGDLYQLQVYLKGMWDVEYQFKNKNYKTKEFVGNVKFLATDERSDLARSLLLIRRMPDNESEYIHQELYKDSNAVLFFHHKAPTHTKPIEYKITEKSAAKVKLKEYGVSDDNCDKLLAICGFK